MQVSIIIHAIYLFLVIFYIVVNYSYGYIYFESPENTRIFYNAYDTQERLGLGRKNYMTYDDDLILLVCHCLTIIMIGY